MFFFSFWEYHSLSSLSSLFFFLPIQDWAVVIAGVGDCKGYLCCDGDILAHDMTPENRFFSFLSFLSF